MNGYLPKSGYNEIKVFNKSKEITGEEYWAIDKKLGSYTAWLNYCTLRYMQSLVIRCILQKSPTRMKLSLEAAESNYPRVSKAFTTFLTF